MGFTIILTLKVIPVSAPTMPSFVLFCVFFFVFFSFFVKLSYRLHEATWSLLFGTVSHLCSWLQESDASEQPRDRRRVLLCHLRWRHRTIATGSHRNKHGKTNSHLLLVMLSKSVTDHACFYGFHPLF